ncbi:cellulose synthase A catalytic subunit 5 [UDP-forming]-like isoform X1 [Iris pallida]|uniref:Cellulose synthase A catalytic subunit 5 [UDP-forming]-like isoform X1 n=1 Tax=Iris pallida TaxID=29817 RepID=A0AAX6DIN2_IRIPA|nr:cellulose synthase A catalytic subunit 5 [UDP-forming]-like isoform X1 [Iris pallida]
MVMEVLLGRTEWTSGKGNSRKRCRRFRLKVDIVECFMEKIQIVMICQYEGRQPLSRKLPIFSNKKTHTG